MHKLISIAVIVLVLYSGLVNRDSNLVSISTAEFRYYVIITIIARLGKP